MPKVGPTPSTTVVHQLKRRTMDSPSPEQTGEVNEASATGPDRTKKGRAHKRVRRTEETELTTDCDLTQGLQRVSLAHSMSSDDKVAQSEQLPLLSEIAQVAMLPDTDEQKPHSPHFWHGCARTPEYIPEELPVQSPPWVPFSFPAAVQGKVLTPRFIPEELPEPPFDWDQFWACLASSTNQLRSQSAPDEMPDMTMRTDDGPVVDGVGANTDRAPNVVQRRGAILSFEA